MWDSFGTSWLPAAVSRPAEALNHSHTEPASRANEIALPRYTRVPLISLVSKAPHRCQNKRVISLLMIIIFDLYTIFFSVLAKRKMRFITRTLQSSLASKRAYPGKRFTKRMVTMQNYANHRIGRPPCIVRHVLCSIRYYDGRACTLLTRVLLTIP